MTDIETTLLLQGGYVNMITTDGETTVSKQFQPTPFSSKSPKERFLREYFALLFQGRRGLSPAFILSRIDTLTIVQKYIKGKTFEQRIEEGENPEIIMETAGRLLREIHSPVKGNIDVIKQKFYRKIDTALKRAKPIIEHEKIEINFNINWEKVNELGITRTHGDFWLSNIISDGENTLAIDWEYAGIGSPYEDFIAVYLWIFRKYGHENAFLRGYDKNIDPSTIIEFVKLECIEYLASITLDEYLAEEEDGFYHQIAKVLKEIV